MSGVRVRWKDEDRVGGQPVGPVSVIPPGIDPLKPRPYQRRCEEGGWRERAERATERNEYGDLLCPDCGGVIERWVTHAEALRIAAQNDVELED